LKNLISKRLSSSLIGGRPFVSFRRCLIPASLYAILHPIAGGRPADEIELVLRQVKKDGITDDIAIVIARDEVFCLIDFEILEAIDAQIRKHFERIRPFDINVRHMMGLIEQSAGFAPRTLFIPPVRELVTNHGKRVGTDLRIPQQFNRISHRLQDFLQAFGLRDLGTHAGITPS